MIFLFLLLLLPATAMGGNNPFQYFAHGFKESLTAISKAGKTTEAIAQDQEVQAFVSSPYYTLNDFYSKNSIVFTKVNITNRSDKKVSFVLSAIHTTQEKTNMYSKKYKAYLTQSVVTDPVEASPMQTVAVSSNALGLELGGTEKIFGLVIFAAQVQSTRKDVKKNCASMGGGRDRYPNLSPTPMPNGIAVLEMDEGYNLIHDAQRNPIIKGYISPEEYEQRFSGFPPKVYVPSFLKPPILYIGTKHLDNLLGPAKLCQVFEDELKVTEHMDTYMSNPKTKQITLKTAQNYFDFPQDFIFNAKTERVYIIPNAEKIIADMRAVEKKYNKAIFPPHYFKKEVIEGLPKEELGNLGSYVAKLLQEPVPIRLATLGTLLDCGKYNGIAAALVKIALAIVTLVVTGGVASFIMDAVDSGMNFSKEIKDAKMRG